MARLPAVQRPKFDPWALMGQARRAKPKPAPELSPEEESKLLRASIGLATYIGESLDKPGAAVRGVMATGDPAQLLHAIPFSEAMDLAPKKKVWGRELLRGWGMVGPNKPGLWRGPRWRDVDWGDVAGFGAEIALDPLWLVAGLPLVKGAAKAAGAAGKAAKSLTAARAGLKGVREGIKAGKLTGYGKPLRTAAGYAEQIRKGERAVVGLQLPFTKKPFATMGEGSRLGAWAVEKTFYGGGRLNPMVWMRGLFSHSAGAENLAEFFVRHPGQLQKAKDLAYAERQLLQDAMADLAPALTRKHEEIFTEFNRIAQHHGRQGDRAAFDAFSRSMLEAKQGLPHGDQMLASLRQHLELPAGASIDDIVEDSSRLADDFYDYLDTILEVQDSAYDRVRALGGPGGLLEDVYVRHSARRPSRPQILSRTEKATDPHYRWFLARRLVLRDMPGGSGTINAIARDPLLTATKGSQGGPLKEQLRRLLGDMGIGPQDIPNKLGPLQDQYLWKRYVQPEMDEFWRTAPTNEAGELLDNAGQVVLRRGAAVTREAEIARWTSPTFVGETTPGLRQRPPKQFRSHLTTVKDHFRRLPEQVRERGIFDRAPIEDALDYMKTVLEWESNLRSMHRFLASPGVVHLASATKGRWKARGGGVPLTEAWGSIRTFGKRRGLDPEGLGTFVRENMPEMAQGLDADGMARLIGDLRITEGAVPVVQNYMHVLMPETKAQFGRMVDKVNGLFRGWLFTAWPAAHNRNWGSGVYQAWSDGRVNLSEVLQGHWAAARRLTKGEPLSQVTEDILKTSDMLKGTGPMAEIVGREAAQAIPGVPAVTGGRLLPWILSPLTPKAMREKGWQAINPLATRGWQQATPAMRAAGTRPAISAWQESGERAYQVVEFLNRAGYAEALARKGFEPSEIIHLVKRSQFDYSAANKFERTIMQRGVLFWQWPRQNTPYTLLKLIERPGGKTAQTLRAMRVARGAEEEHVPSFLRETLGIRTGGTPEAAQFIWQSGLPPEELNRIVLGQGLPTSAIGVSQEFLPGPLQRQRFPGKRTFQRGAAQLHPLLMLSPELYAGRQMYTGREISGLYGPTEHFLGRKIPALDRAIHYSPLSRVARELMGVFDTRKTKLQRAANALTGFKTGTYDVEKLRESDLRRAIERELKGEPYVYELRKPYIPKAKREQAGAAVQRRLKQLQAVNRRIRELREKQEARKGG